MAGFKYTFENFGGLRPKVSEHKLPEGEARRCFNVDTGTTDLIPFRSKLTEKVNDSAGDTQTIYEFKNGGSPLWFEWTTEVQVARGPIKDDVLERTYYTGDGQPKYTYTTIADGGGGGPYPEEYRNLGVPAPDTAPTLTVNALPESLSQSARKTSSMAANLFQVAQVEFTNYLSGAGRTAPWSFDAAETSGTIIFTFPAGTLLRVKTITDANNVVVESADSSGIICEASSTYNKVMDNDGNAEDANFNTWRIPELKLGITGHLLREGDVIKVTQVSTTGLKFFGTLASTKFYAQSWGSDQSIEEGGATVNQVVDANVGANVDATTDFTIDSNFWYEVVRSSSTISESERRFYVYTFVSSLGEEGPPSPVSDPLDCLDGDSVAIASLATPPSANYDLTDIRIYRTNSTEDGADYQFVKELAAAGSTTDTVENVDLGELIPSTTWLPPAADMKYITALPNGMMVGFKGKTLFFCEPYFPHAWPAEYDQAVEFDIVALAQIGNSAVVLTTGTPFLLSGSHPRNVNVRPFTSPYACANARSAATTNDKVYYSSPDGLIEISSNGVVNITEEYCDQRDWLKFKPSTMLGAIYDGRYVGFYDGAQSIPQGAVSMVTSGTVGDNINVDDLIATGGDIVLTLTNDFWVDNEFGEFDLIRQDIIDGIVSAEDEANGWNQLVRPSLTVDDVVRTSDSVVTIAVAAQPTYVIPNAGVEVVRATAPAVSLKISSSGVSSTDTFSITSVYSTIVENNGGNGSFVVPAGVTSVDLLMVAGGGGGGVDGAGGGGGGLREETVSVTPGETVRFIVGAGGTGGGSPADGADTEWDVDASFTVGTGTIIATGGGKGGTVTGVVGGDGGSGGGGAQGGGDPEGTGIPGQGNDGGAGDYSGSVAWTDSRVGGGGGGAGSAGGLGVRIDITDESTCTSGAGGAGLDVSERWGTDYGLNGVFAAGGTGGGSTCSDVGGTIPGPTTLPGGGTNADAVADTGSGGGAGGGVIDTPGNGSDGVLLIGYN